jgi:RHS repeat-associated protein
VDEFHLYGSSRLGVYEANRLISKRVARDLNLDNQITSNEYVIETPEEVTYLFSSYQLERGAKRYELSNHLGNVLTVISDKKTAVFTGTTFNYFAAEHISATDYSPFGAPLASRTWQSSEYRFGFNTQERDDEIAGVGNIMTAQFWEYDSRLGRRWNVDPVKKPHLSLYSVLSNNPIRKIDIKGDDDYYDLAGKYIGSDNEKTSNIRLITNKRTFEYFQKEGVEELHKNSRIVTVDPNSADVIRKIYDESCDLNIERKAYIILDTKLATLSVEIQPIDPEKDTEKSSSNIYTPFNLAQGQGSVISPGNLEGKVYEEKVIVGQIHGHPDKKVKKELGTGLVFNTENLQLRPSPDDEDVAEELKVPVYAMDQFAVRKTSPGKQNSSIQLNNIHIIPQDALTTYSGCNN